MEKLFEIKNLNCSYDRTINNSVLFVDELIIPKSKFVVILGKSGSGKSTLLETLGLMHNTLVENSNVHFYENGTIDKFELLWNSSQNRISQIRKEHFSFIFQDTNLMPNFTIYENLAISQLIQDVSPATAYQNIIQEMNNVHLSEISHAKSPNELSGGEKQRSAFVRAITPQYSVLFGDEPTGNLDWDNAVIIMEKMKQQVTDFKKSVIVVTHDIRLALKFADQIIIVEKIKKSETSLDYIGKIKKENIFVSENNSWFDINSLDVTAKIEEKINLLLKPSGSLTEVKPTQNNLSFLQLFFRKEGYSLIIEGRNNFIFSIIGLFLTLFAVSFTNERLSNLKNQKGKYFRF